VVIIDTTNDGAFTTTTTGRSEVTVGVAQETIASNATGRILLAGYAALVNVPASVTRGHYVETHTVAKQATGNSTRRSGSFGQFRTGGTTPTATLWGKPDVTSSGGTTITYQQNQLAADVNLATANTYFDGPSVTLSAGTWLLIGSVLLDGGGGSATQVTSKLWDGTTVAASTETMVYGGGAYDNNPGPLTAVVVIASGTPTWKISCANNASTASKIKAAASDNGAGNNASTLVAIKIA
jgi:hypothetical protein